MVAHSVACLLVVYRLVSWLAWPSEVLADPREEQPATMWQNPEAQASKDAPHHAVPLFHPNARIENNHPRLAIHVERMGFICPTRDEYESKMGESVTRRKN